MNSLLNRLPWLIIFFGAFLRLHQYFFNRSLWLDEAFISLNILNRPYLKLLEALDFNQGGPVGFLILTKSFVQLFGNSDYILRLYPILCGLISLILFYKFVKNRLEPKVALIALFLFAICDPLVFYSSEVKQYSGDVVMTMALYLLAVYMEQNTLTLKKTLFAAVIGAVAIWFSHPAIFVLLGIGFTITISFISQKLWEKVGRMFVCWVFWIASLITLYYANLSKLNANAIEYFGVDSFMQILPTPEWIYSRFGDVFYLMKLSQYRLPQILFVIGVICMGLKKRHLFYMLSSPILFTLIASSFHKYPFVGRLLLFLVPLYLILIAEGAGYCINFVNRFSPFLQIIVIGFLIFSPLQYAVNCLVTPRTVQEIKEVLAFIKERRKPGDVIYVYHSAQYAFKYYAKKFGFNDDFLIEYSEHSSDPSALDRYEKPGYNTIVLGITSPENKVRYIDQLNKLRGNSRVWILFSHVWEDEGSLILKHLDKIGIRRHLIKNPGYFNGSAAYLYDLSSTANP